MTNFVLFVFDGGDDPVKEIEFTGSFEAAGKLADSIIEKGFEQVDIHAENIFGNLVLVG